MAENEVWLVERLHAALQNSTDGRLKRIQFLVRPHPANYLNYTEIKRRDIAVAPKGTLPKSDEAMQTFYDTLYYAVAAIGINTSSMLMAIIAGKPVLTILTDTYRKTQEETQHFRQLLEHDALEAARDEGEFVHAAVRLLGGNDFRKEQRRRFIEKFVRPRGLAVVAGDIAAQEIISYVNA